MSTTKTTSDYLKMSSGEKKKLVKVVLRKANQDQLDLVKRYDEAVKNKEITPV